MRLRKIKNALDKLKQNEEYFIDSFQTHKGNWAKLFANDHPIHIEIGCGKGQFISQMALENSNINYIAIEKYDSVLLRALEKIENKNIPNLKLVLLDASLLEECFAEGEISRIYINFSDPWPKAAHKKRRLTYQSFLDRYKYILKEDGEVFQKTDNRKFFEFSLESFSQNQWVLSNISLDLHQDTETENVVTEFEEKWSKLGPIYRLEAHVKR